MLVFAAWKAFVERIKPMMGARRLPTCAKALRRCPRRVHVQGPPLCVDGAPFVSQGRLIRSFESGEVRSREGRAYTCFDFLGL